MSNSREMPNATTTARGSFCGATKLYEAVRMSDRIIQMRLISRLEMNLLPGNIRAVRYDRAYYPLYGQDEFRAFLDEFTSNGAEVLMDGLRPLGKDDPVLPFIKSWERSLGHY